MCGSDAQQLGEDSITHAGSAFPPHCSLALRLFAGRKEENTCKEARCKLSWPQAPILTAEKRVFTDTQYPGVSEDVCRLRAPPRSGEDRLSGKDKRERKKKAASGHILAVPTTVPQQQEVSLVFRRLLTGISFPPPASGSQADSLILKEGGIPWDMIPGKRSAFLVPMFFPTKPTLLMVQRTQRRRCADLWAPRCLLRMTPFPLLSVLKSQRFPWTLVLEEHTEAAQMRSLIQSAFTEYQLHRKCCVCWGRIEHGHILHRQRKTHRHTTGQKDNYIHHTGQRDT